MVAAWTQASSAVADGCSQRWCPGSLAGGDGDLSVISSGVMGRLGIDSDDDSWRWLVEVDRVVVSDYWRVYASCAAGCDAARQP